jgi:hypothetical protein
VPEDLPADEDVKKVQRRLSTEEKKLPQETRLAEPPGLEQLAFLESDAAPPC